MSELKMSLNNMKNSADNAVKDAVSDDPFATADEVNGASLNMASASDNGVDENKTSDKGAYENAETANAATLDAESLIDENAIDDSVDFSAEIDDENAEDLSESLTATEPTALGEDFESELAAFAGVSEAATTTENVFVDDISGFAKGFPDWDLLPPLQRKKK